MMRDDTESLAACLEELWPGKFTGEMIASLARTLHSWDIDEVRAACVHFKMNSRNRPYAGELKDMLIEMYPRKSMPVADRPASRFRTVIGKQWAESNPDRKDEPEPWLVMRYYRYWFFRARKSITGAADARKELGKPPFPEDDSRIEVLTSACVNNCKGDLIACGLNSELADSAASWVNSGEMEFESYLSDLSAELDRQTVAVA